MDAKEKQRSEGYEHYPSNIRQKDFDGLDLHRLDLELKNKSSSLFVTESKQCRVEVLEVIPISKVSSLTRPITGKQGSKAEIVEATCIKPLFRTISTWRELKDILQRDLPRGSLRLFTWHRANSWSRMKISLEMFEAICTHDKITPRFLSIIFGLGRKLASKDEDFMTCYSEFSNTSKEKHAKVDNDGDKNDTPSRSEGLSFDAYDICYNVRYFERHGRDLADPWSCRQSAIHQKYYFDNDESRWIIIQPLKLFESKIKAVERWQTKHPMSIHFWYLGAAIANWREFLDYINENLVAIDQKVSLSKPFRDFDIDFSLSQQLHVLNRKLDHARFILESTLETLTSMKKHAIRVAKIKALHITTTNQFEDELDNMSNDLKNYLFSTCKLLRLSEHLRLMNNDILQFRDHQSLHENGLDIAQIARQDAIEKKLMSVLAEKTASDSRTTRIATIIAMVYLPANLVMSFFSSSLVEVESNGTINQGGTVSMGIQIRREIWIAIVTTIVLAALTLLPTIYLDRKNKKRDMGVLLRSDFCP